MNFRLFLLFIFFQGLSVTVVQAQEAQRIVALAPSLAEIVADLLASPTLDRLVGFTEYTDFPPLLLEKAKKCPNCNVGPFFKPNRERIVALHPDLVLATKDGTPQDLVTLLSKDKSKALVVVGGSSLKDVAESYLQIGRALGRVEAAYELKNNFEKSLDQLRVEPTQCHLSGKKVLIAFQSQGREPLTVVGRDNFINDGLKLIGLKNIYDLEGSVGSRYPRPSFEDILNRKPELVVILGTSQGDFKSLPQAKTILFSDDRLQRPTRRFAQGLLALREKMQAAFCHE